MKANLALLQARVQNYILKQDEAILPFVQQSVTNSIEERLNIYADGYSLRLIEVLAIDYPNLKKYLGEDKFEEIARNYIAVYPSNRYSVNDYGRNLSQFLQKDHPQWSEMARFEWAIGLALIAADSAIVEYQEIAAIPQQSWDVMQFVFHPSLQVLQLHWNIEQLWQALEQNKALPEIQAKIPAEYWLVWRRQNEIRFIHLPQLNYQLLLILQQGYSLGQACERIKLPANEMAIFIVKFITQSLNAQWLAKVSLPNH